MSADSPAAYITDPLVLLEQLSAQRLGFGFDEVVDRMAGPERIGTPAITVLDAEHLVEDLQVVGDAERVARILVGEVVVEIVERRLRDGRQAQGAGFVGGQKYQVASRSRSAIS